METLFVTRDAQLRQRENTLTLKIGDQTRFFPIEKLRHLVLLGESRLNTRLLTLLGKHGVRLSVFDYYGYFKGCFEPIDKNPSGRVKLLQAQTVLHPDQRLALAREFVRGASHNMRANLRYYRYRGCDALQANLKAMDRLEEEIGRTRACDHLMGIEGNLHQHYYAGWKQIDSALDFGPRVRRPPNNPVNCLISFLNQLTYTVVRHELFKTHLDESFSFLHSVSGGRSSLSLDLAEPFKPILADQLIFRFYRKHIVADNWFDQQEGVCLLTETGRRHVAEQFAQRLEERYRERTYREWIYRECLGIERHLLGVEEYDAFKRRV